MLFLTHSDINALHDQETLLPKLSSLELYLGDQGVDVLFQGSLDPSGELPNSYVKIHSERQIDRSVFRLLEINSLNLTRLWFFDVNKSEYKNIVHILNKGCLKNLTDLGIVMWRFAKQEKMEESMSKAVDPEGRQAVIVAKGNLPDRLPGVRLQNVTRLAMHRIVCTMHHLYWMTKRSDLSRLDTLDISHSSDISGTLSILLCHKFPMLHTLVLSDCGLSSTDLRSLAEANRKGRLPKTQSLRYLEE